MKRTLTLLFLLAMTAIVSAASQNILLIIADDYGADSSSLYNSTNNGASLPPTPNLVSLAQSGVLFRNAYANPVCSPTRATIMTGLPEAFAANSGLGYPSRNLANCILNGVSTANYTNYATTDLVNDAGPAILSRHCNRSISVGSA